MASTFAERLRRLIDDKKISQAAVARGLEISPTRIIEWLSGEVKKPQRKTLYKLCDFFGCDFEWLKDGTGEPFPPDNLTVIDDFAASIHQHKPNASDGNCAPPPSDSGNSTEEPSGKYLKSIILMWDDISEEDQQAVFSSVKKAKQLRELMTEMAGIKKKVGE